MATQVNFLNLSESTANTWGMLYGKDGKLLESYEGGKVILSSSEGAVIQHIVKAHQRHVRDVGEKS